MRNLRKKYKAPKMLQQHIKYKRIPYQKRYYKYS